MKLLAASLLSLPLLFATRPTSATENASLDPDVGSAPGFSKALTQCLAPLSRDAQAGFPLILWETGHGVDELDDDQLRALWSRGIAVHLPVDLRGDQRARDIGRAHRLRRLGIPLVLRDVGGQWWPRDAVPGLATEHCADLSPLDLTPWRRVAQGWTDLLAELDGTGAEVFAALTDYEGLPATLPYRVALECRAEWGLPASATSSPAAYFDYRRQLWRERLSTFVAGPIRQRQPRALVGNWAVVRTGKVPVLSWDGWAHPQGSMGRFNASVPIAYGIDLAFPDTWNGRIDPRVIYANLLLRQVSADIANGSSEPAPGKVHSVPWIARVVKDTARRVPVLTRAQYRDLLRHLWLRGIRGVQVFNPIGEDAAMAFAEVQDAQLVYGELQPLLATMRGTSVLNLAIPEASGSASILWSGLQSRDSAIVRASSLSGGDEKLRLELWQGVEFALSATELGTTYVLRPNGEIRILPDRVPQSCQLVGLD